MKIKIGNKEYNVTIAETEEEQNKGLQDVEEMNDDEGMLFIYDEPEEEISFWMKDTTIPLDVIFIGENMNVISIKQGEPESEELLTENNVQYVLEVNINSGIKIGDELELENDVTLKKGVISVIGSDGNVQMELEGGERIFSRKNTRVLINYAKKAHTSKSDKDYKKLGKYAFKFLEIQDSNEPEYVQKTDTK